MESRAPPIPAINPLPSSLPADKPLTPSGATASSSGSESPADSSSSGPDDAPPADPPPLPLFRAERSARGKACCPLALAAALQALVDQPSSSSPSSSSCSAASSPSSPSRAIPSAAPMAAPSLEVPMGGSSLPEPSSAMVGHPADSALLLNQPSLASLAAAVPSLVGAAPLLDRSHPIAEANSGAVSLPDVAKPAATAVGAAATANLPYDRALFLRNQNELNNIRAQLKALKSKELVNPWRGGFVEGRNNKKSHTVNGSNHAHMVFDNMSKPILAGPMAGVRPGGHGPSRAPPPPPLRKAWVAAVSSNLNEKKFNLTYRSPKVVNGKPIVVASDAALDLARSRWSDYLVGYFLEGRLPFPTVEGIAKSLWAKHGLAETLSFNKEFFLFKFPNEASRKALLDHGPFLFAGRPLILQHWSPSLKLYKEGHSKIPLWVKIHHIPLAMWNPIGLGDIASAIGNPLYVDNVTETLQRLDFARICIEVDASNPLLDEITLQVGDELINLQVEYQWRPKRCPLCCSFGHICKPTPPTGSAATKTAPVTVSTASETAATVSFAAVTASTSAVTAAGHVFVDAEDLPLAPLPSVAAAVPITAAGPSATQSRPGGILSVQNLDSAATFAAAVAAAPPVPALASVATNIPPRAAAPVPVPAPVGVPATAPAASAPVPVPACVEGLALELSDASLECDEDDSEECLDGASQYEAPLSPKTRGQKARNNLILQPPRGSGQRKKKKGKRAKR